MLSPKATISKSLLYKNSNINFITGNGDNGGNGSNGADGGKNTWTFIACKQTTGGNSGDGGTGGYEDDLKIIAESKKARAGGTVSINITLEDNPGLVNLLLSVSYDQSVLTLVNVEDGGIISKPNNSSTYTSNPYKLAWEDDIATENYTGNGVLTKLTFQVAEDAPEGEYAITLSHKAGDAYDVDMNDVSVAITSGNVTVTAVLKGDVNGDGNITSKDRTILSRYLAGWDGYEQQVVLDACDINEDGIVNGKDRTILSRYLAGWGGSYDTYFN